MTPPEPPPEPRHPPAPTAATSGVRARRRLSGAWRTVLWSAVTVAVLLVVFVGVFPNVADYSQVWSLIQQLPAAYVVALAVATVVNIAAYVWPLRAALPGLGYGAAFVVGQTGFAVSNAAPAGGAVGLGVQYGMLSSYGFGAGAASAVAIVGVFNVLATLVMPVIGVVALSATGGVTRSDLLIAALGVLAIGVAVGAFTAVLRSESGARTVGRWADRLVNPLLRRLRRARSVDLTARFVEFRSDVVGALQARWVQLILSSLLLQFTSWAILFLALRGLQGDAVTVEWTEALAAFSLARVVSVIPITPGGLGTVDGALVALLTGFGATSSQALAADLVWRAAAYVPQVLLGAFTFLWWRITAQRRRQRITRRSSNG